MNANKLGHSGYDLPEEVACPASTGNKRGLSIVLVTRHLQTHLERRQVPVKQLETKITTMKRDGNIVARIVTGPIQFVFPTKCDHFL